MEPSIDFLTATEGGTRGLEDPEVLRIAAASGRILVSNDRNTMIRHFKSFISEHDSPGLLVLKQTIPTRLAVAQIQDLWNEIEAEAWRNVVMFGRTSDSD